MNDVAAITTVKKSLVSIFRKNFKQSTIAGLHGSRKFIDAVISGILAFFQKIEKKTDYILKNMNVIIGSITAIVSVITLINILEHYLR